MKLEIYQVGKVPPLTIVECDEWEVVFDFGTPRLKVKKNRNLVGMFFVNNIAGFKEVGDTE